MIERIISLAARRSAWAIVATLGSVARMASAAPNDTGSEPASSASGPQVSAVSIVQVPWQVLDLGFRVRPGQAWMTSRVLSAGDYMPWAYRPTFGATSSNASLLTGGDVGLTDFLTLRLYGAHEFISSRDSSMMMGLQLHLTPPSSLVQASIFQGLTEGSSDGRHPGRGAFGQFALKMSWPNLQLGYSLGATMPLTGAPTSPSLVSVAGAHYTAGPVRLGIEHVAEGGGSTNDSQSKRQLVVGSATTVVPKSNVQIGVTSSHGLRGTPSVPAKVGVSLGF